MTNKKENSNARLFFSHLLFPFLSLVLAVLVLHISTLLPHKRFIFTCVVMLIFTQQMSAFLIVDLLLRDFYFQLLLHHQRNIATNFLYFNLCITLLIMFLFILLIFYALHELSRCYGLPFR